MGMDDLSATIVAVNLLVTKTMAAAALNNSLAVITSVKQRQVNLLVTKTIPAAAVINSLAVINSAKHSSSIC